MKDTTGMTGDEALVREAGETFLAFANIADTIERHLDTRCLMIDVETRALLAALRDAAAARASEERRRIDERPAAAVRPALAEI